MSRKRIKGCQGDLGEDTPILMVWERRPPGGGVTYPVTMEGDAAPQRERAAQPLVCALLALYDGDTAAIRRLLDEWERTACMGGGPLDA